MLENEVNLTEQELNALREISRRTGKAESDLIHEAVERFIAQFQKQDRLALMQKARGIWKDRQDLSSLKDLRDEWDRD